MRRLYLAVLFSLLAWPCFTSFVMAQKEAYNWYFGNKAGLSFAGGSPIALTDGQLVTNEGCSTISDASGNLLFYTDGSTVWNRNHAVMTNGSNLDGNSSSSQSAVVQLMPGSSTKYYIFTTDAAESSKQYGLRCSIVDMAGSGGLGSVTLKNVVIDLAVSEKVTIVKHSNGLDFWVISHENTNDAFIAYLLSASGLSTTPAVSSIGEPNYNSYGYLKASHSGKKIIHMNSKAYGGMAELLDFDNSTGLLSNLYSMKRPNVYGAEFSGRDQFLYFCYGSSADTLCQLNLVTLQQTVVATNKTTNYFGALQLALDGKIYLARDQASFLSAIESPELSGTACNFINNAVILAGRNSQLGLPSFSQSLISAVDSVFWGNICFKDNTVFSTGNFVNVASMSWNFGDIFSGAANTSTALSPTHVFSAAGNYKVRLIVTHTDGTKDTVDRKVVIRPLPVILLSPSSALVCPGDTVRVTASGLSNYKWNVTGTPAVIDNDSLLVVAPPATMAYTVTGSDTSGCVSSTQITVSTRQPPDVRIFVSSDSICRGKGVVLNASGAASYEWSLQTAPSVVVSTSSNYADKPLVTRTYMLRGTDRFGCIAATSKEIYVRGLPVLSVSTTPDTICQGSESILRVKGARDYLWSSGAMPLSADSIFHVQPVTSTTYLVKGTDRYGCEGFDSSRVSVKKKPPVRSILGSPYVCPGLLGVPYKVSDSLPGSPVSTSTFAWTVTRGTPSSGQLLTTDSLRVDFSSVPGTAQVKVVETNQQGCQGDTLYFSVEIKSIFNPPPPRGQDSICTRDTAGQVYHTPYNTPGSVYQWHILGGSIKSGNTTHQVTVNWNTTGLRSGRIWYEERSNTATANCYGLSDTLFVSIFPTPVTGPVQGKLSVCIGEKNLPYSVAVNNSSTFTWTAKGGVIKSGNGTSVITVDWDTIPGPHYLKVLQRGSQGKCPGDTVYATVTVNPTPVVASIEGPGIVCPSKINGLVYYVKGSTPTSTYLWKITGGSIASGAGKDTIRVNWDADFSTKSKVYQLEVTELTQAGCVSLIKIRRISLDGSYPSLDAVSTGLYNDREMEISWPQSYTLGQLSKYSLYRKAAVDSAWQLIAAGLLKNGYTDKSVSTHQLVYQYRYTTKDACGDSSTSRPQNSMVLGAAVSSSGQSILLSWNLYRNWDSGLQKYEVWRKLDNAVDYSFYQAGDTTSRFTVTSTSEGFVQCYRIKAIENGGRNVSWSNDTCLVFTHPVEVPTAFSPNGDGVNDTWVIRSIESYPNASVEVFNRWGEKVYSSQSYTGWNGTSNGKDLPDGTYFYVIRLRKVVDNKQESFSGNVTIMR